jgi:hypothetical protein
MIGYFGKIMECGRKWIVEKNEHSYTLYEHNDHSFEVYQNSDDKN